MMAAPPGEAVGTSLPPRYVYFFRRAALSRSAVLLVAEFSAVSPFFRVTSASRANNNTLFGAPDCGSDQRGIAVPGRVPEKP